MKFAKTITVVGASLGMLVSGLSAYADDSKQPGPMPMPGHGAPPPMATQAPALTAPARTPVTPQHLAPQPQPPAFENDLLTPQPEFGHHRRHRGGPDWDALDGCRCENLELFIPKEKAPEAWLITTGKVPAYTRFVTVRIPIGVRVKCTPVDDFQGCAAYLIIDQDNSAASWNSNVKTLSMLPMKLGCPGKCDGKWHTTESWLTYSGWVVGAWPTAGTLHFRLVGTGCDSVQDADIWVSVTFSGGLFASPGALAGMVQVSYTFSSTHAGN